MKVVGYAGSRSAFSKSICLGEKLKTMLREKNIEMELYTARNNVVGSVGDAENVLMKGYVRRIKRIVWNTLEKNSRSRFNCFTVASLFE